MRKICFWWKNKLQQKYKISFNNSLVIMHYTLPPGALNLSLQCSITAFSSNKLIIACYLVPDSTNTDLKNNQCLTDNYFVNYTMSNWMVTDSFIELNTQQNDLTCVKWWWDHANQFNFILKTCKTLILMTMLGEQIRQFFSWCKQPVVPCSKFLSNAS